MTLILMCFGVAEANKEIVGVTAAESGAATSSNDLVNDMMQPLHPQAVFSNTNASYTLIWSTTTIFLFFKSKRLLSIISVLFVFIMVSKADAVGLNTVSWRFMAGSASVDQNGVCGTAGQYSDGYSPGGRKYAAMTTAYNGHSYLSGGLGFPTSGLAGTLSDVWVYRQTCWSCDGEWAWLGGLHYANGHPGSISGTPYPGSRWGHVSWFTPPNQLHLHGGNGKDCVPSAAGALPDLWSFNTDTYDWILLKGSCVRLIPATYGTKGTPAGGNVPGAVQYHMLLASKSDGTAIIYGGDGYDTSASGYLSDTWKYTSGTTQWTWINGPGSINQQSAGGTSGVYSPSYYPGGRYTSAVMDTIHQSVSDYTYLSCGYGKSSSGQGFLADLWAFNIVTDEWAYIAGESSATGASALGSYGSLGSFSASNHPGARRYTNGKADPNSDLILLFGGIGHCDTATIGNLNDFWAFNTTTKLWSWASSSFRFLSAFTNLSLTI